jgi:very-short-patch-repair endonuclease
MLDLILLTPKSGHIPGIIDSELALFLGITTRALNQAAKRSVHFSASLVVRYQISEADFQEYRRECNVTGKWGGRRFRPYLYSFYGVGLVIARLRLGISQRQKDDLLAVFGEPRFPILDFGEHRPEESITHRLKIVLEGVFSLRTHYPVRTERGNYFLDAYIEEPNLAIEIDEEGHRYKIKEDDLRQKSIEHTLGCQFLRFSERDPVDECINRVLRLCFSVKSPEQTSLDECEFHRHYSSATLDAGSHNQSG